MARGSTMKAIEQAIARLEAEKAAWNSHVDGRLEGLREALRLQGGVVPMPIQDVAQKRTRRGNLKETVLDIAAQVAEKGMTSEECVSLAKDTKGVELIRESVSSLLSRRISDGVMFFDGHRYRLMQFSGPRQAA